MQILLKENGGEKVTDRSSEERSRFEKWLLAQPHWIPAQLLHNRDGSYCIGAIESLWSGWQARAALEDRQEAPKWQRLPDEQAWWWHWNGEDLSIPHIYCVMVSKTGRDRYFIAHPDSRWCDEMGGAWLKIERPNVPDRGVFKPAEDRQEAAPETWQTVTGYPDGTLKITPGRISGVPSEATPSKENAGLEAQKWNGQLQPNGTVYDDAVLIQILRAENAQFLKMYEEERMKHFVPPPPLPGTISSVESPVPEVQGTPTKENSIKAQIAEIAAHPASGLFQQNALVGTPQKETPPMSDKPSYDELIQLQRNEIIRLKGQNAILRAAGIMALRKATQLTFIDCDKLLDEALATEPPAAPLAEGVQGKEP